MFLVIDCVLMFFFIQIIHCEVVFANEEISNLNLFNIR